MMRCSVIFFCKQKTAYEMRISDWSSDVCSSDLMNRAANSENTPSIAMPHKRSGRLISQIKGASNNARNASGQHNTSSNNQLVTSIRVFMIDSAGSGFEVLEFAPQLQLLLRDAGFDRPQPAFQSLETGLDRK